MQETGTTVSPRQALHNFFGFDHFKGDQEEIIQSLLAGRNSFVIMPTGGGKSLCYQLPALMSEGTAIVVSPLIALMKNQVDSIRSFHTQDGIAHFLNSSLTKADITRVKQDVTDGVTKLLYVAPESLTKQENIDFLTGITISFVAIDEAHCISEWGHDFRPEYRRLRTIINAIDDVPIIALTATATPKVQQDIQKNLEMVDANVFKASFNRPNLYYEVRPKIDVSKEIIRFVKRMPGKSGIVYCLSRKKVEEIAQVLVVNGIKALPYHAGMDAGTRARHQDNFLMEDVDVIVATIAFGMGIDKPDVRFVIHHDMPKSLESYYQETGRAGRDGGEGHCLAFYSYKDIEKLEKFLQGKPVAEQEIGRQLLSEVVAYAETSISRRKFLLHYFGEEFDEVDGDGAEMDDNTRHPKERYEGGKEAQKLLETVQLLKEKHKAKYISDFLCGGQTNEIATYKHNKLPEFGSGIYDGHDERFWNAVVRQCVIAGFLSKEIEQYGILKLTDAGREFIENPTSFTLIKEHDYSSIDDAEELIMNQKGGGKSVIDEELYTLLKDLRKKISSEKNLPPFVIFQDPSLQDMALQYPIDLDELMNIAGVGQGKAQRYGRPFVKLIEKYVKDNEIERPQDLVVKSIVNKSGTKVGIIMNIDRKLPLEDIASAKNLSISDLIKEIEVIVSSGTKVNIEYHINDILDEETQEEIYDYWREAESDSLQDALEEFDHEYSDDEMRLMRIKFMSEMAH